MSVELNHVIFRAKDKWASARFLAGILGIEAGPEWGRFVPVRVANGVTLDFADTPERLHSILHFSSVMPNSTPPLRASAMRAARSMLTLTARGAVKSTIFTAAAASISRTRTATCWN